MLLIFDFCFSCDCSDQNATTVTENKKKKDRRKEESTPMETSDEEAASMQGKTGFPIAVK